MKKLLLSVLLLSACFSLSAQVFREAKIFVPPVNDYSVTEDQAFFYKQLTYEVVLQYHSLVRTSYSSDFILKGSIVPYTGDEQFLIGYEPEEPVSAAEDQNQGPVPARPIPRIRNTFGRREFFSWDVGGDVSFYDSTGKDNYLPGNESVYFSDEKNDNASLSGDQDHVFALELINTKTGKVIAIQYLIYRYTDPLVADLVSIMVYNMLSNIPDIEADLDWRENWLFAGFNAMWSPRVYTGQQQSVAWVNFGLGASLEYHFLDFMSVSLGLQFSQDWVVVTKTAGDEYRDLMLEIPLSLSYVFKPQQFMLEPYAGAALNISLMGTTKPSTFSWFLGFQLGMKAGSGMVVIDPRFSMDFAKSYIPQSNAYYQRYLIQIAVGYKFGFVTKYPRLRDY